MKSLVRLATVLGIVGSTLLGPSLIGKMSALALPEQQVLEKLGSVAIFTLMDSQGVLLTLQIPPQANTPPNTQVSLAPAFISQQDAQNFLDQTVKAQDPKIAQSLKVTPVSLGQVYQAMLKAKDQPERLVFKFIPSKQQVDSAMTVLRQTGQQVNEFKGVPLFYASWERGYLVLQNGQQQDVPIFFSKEDLQGLVDQIKQKQPDVASTLKIEVVSLEVLMDSLTSSNDPFLTQIKLVPSPEARQVLQLLQSNNGRNANPSAPQQTQPQNPPTNPQPARPQNQSQPRR